MLISALLDVAEKARANRAACYTEGTNAKSATFNGWLPQTDELLAEEVS